MAGMRFEEINPPACPPKKAPEVKAKPKAKPKAETKETAPNPLKKPSSY